MTGYCKLFQSILGSSIWFGTEAELRTWIAMLVLKDRDHVVKMSARGLANIARVTPDECRAALAKFQEPDPDSTNKANEGRKIRQLEEGGWLVLNGEYYARLLSWDERKEYNRIKQQEYRDKKKAFEKHRKRARVDGSTKAVVEAVSEANDRAVNRAHPHPVNGDERGLSDLQAHIDTGQDMPE
jgi:hypothetical protein